MNQIVGRIEGRDVQSVTLTGRDGLTAKILTYGARLTELWVADRAGGFADIVLGHDSLADWQAGTAFLGATCGRHANRIAGGRFVLDGQDIRLDCNDGGNHLHGGREGFDRKLWDIAAQGADHLTLTATSPEGEMGYPGRLSMRCTYRIDDTDRLWIVMEAETTAPTVVNMVNHAYFNLAGHASGAVTDQVLRLWADRYTPVDASLIPTGEVVNVAGTAFDFTAPRPIGAPLPGEGGLDHNWCLSAPAEAVGAEHLRPCAEAVDPASGRRLMLWTDAPGVQVYTGAHLGGQPPGKAGIALVPFGGFTLETQGWPDAPNHPDFPPARLDPGQTYRHVMAFSFTPQPA